MPSRLIKESICTSEKISGLSDFHFRLWVCLITYVDDFGRGDARAAIIKGRCFPLRDRITAKDIDVGLHVLADTGCIILYEVDGESYLCFPNWNKHQTIRNQKSKYPAPQAIENNCEQMQAVVSNCKQIKANFPVIQSNPNPNPNPIVSETQKRFRPPTVNEVEAYCKERNNKVDAQRFVDFYESKGWLVGKSPMKSWKACVRTWEEREKSPTVKQKTVTAQQYEQRDYSGVQNQLIAQQDKEMEEYIKSQEGAG